MVSLIIDESCILDWICFFKDLAAHLIENFYIVTFSCFLLVVFWIGGSKQQRWRNETLYDVQQLISKTRHWLFGVFMFDRLHWSYKIFYWALYYNLQQILIAFCGLYIYYFLAILNIELVNFFTFFTLLLLCFSSCNCINVFTDLRYI